MTVINTDTKITAAQLFIKVNTEESAKKVISYVKRFKSIVIYEYLVGFDGDDFAKNRNTIQLLLLPKRPRNTVGLQRFALDIDKIIKKFGI